MDNWTDSRPTNSASAKVISEFFTLCNGAAGFVLPRLRPGFPRQESVSSKGAKARGVGAGGSGGRAVAVPAQDLPGYLRLVRRSVTISDNLRSLFSRGEHSHPSLSSSSSSWSSSTSSFIDTTVIFSTRSLALVTLPFIQVRAF